MKANEWTLRNEERLQLNLFLHSFEINAFVQKGETNDDDDEERRRRSRKWWISKQSAEKLSEHWLENVRLNALKSKSAKWETTKATNTWRKYVKSIDKVTQSTASTRNARSKFWWQRVNVFFPWKKALLFRTCRFYLGHKNRMFHRAPKGMN